MRKHDDPKSPAPVRLLAARAMVPMAPRDQVQIVYALTFDPEPKIAQTARKTFMTLSPRIIEAVIGDTQVASPVLGLLAQIINDDAALMEKLLLNPSAPDSAFIWVGEHSALENSIEMVANNQQRLLRTHEIVRALKRNPNTLRSTLDRVVDFMVRAGVLLTDVPEFAESFSRLNQKEIEEAVSEVQVPYALCAPEEQARLKAIGLAPANAPMPTLETEDENLSLDDLDVLAAAEDLEKAAGETEERKSTLEQLRVMTVAQLVKVAMVGNKEVRGILLRSTVRMVAEAAIRSPRLTDMEVIAAASSRSVQDVVIRYISGNRDMTRLYQVKLALCNNPKTPLVHAMSFLRMLRANDLRAIAKSKNIPSVLCQTAKRMLTQKSGA
jgi:hypothetical protein